MVCSIILPLFARTYIFLFENTMVVIVLLFVSYIEARVNAPKQTYLN